MMVKQFYSWHQSGILQNGIENCHQCHLMTCNRELSSRNTIMCVCVTGCVLYCMVYGDDVDESRLSCLSSRQHTGYTNATFCFRLRTSLTISTLTHRVPKIPTKVKIVTVHALKTHGRSRRFASLILNQATKWCWLVSFTFQPLYLWERTSTHVPEKDSSRSSK